MTTIATPLSIEQYNEKRLNQSRIELLATIRYLQGQTELGQDQSRNLCAQKAQFNRIADSINSLQAKTRSDPINKLPPEIFTQIIFNAVPDTGHLWDGVNYNFFVLPLTLISTRWIDFITNTPIFWTKILLDERVPDCFPIASTFLQLSRQLPISVDILWSPSLESSIIWPEMKKHRNRITRIKCDFAYCSPLSEQNSTKLRDFIARLSPLPLINTLIYLGPSSDDSTVQHVLNICPTLTEIHGIKLTKESVQCLMLRNCKTIALWYNIDSMLPLLEDNPALNVVSEHLDLFIRGPTSVETSSRLKKPVKWETMNLNYLTKSLSIDITEKMTQLISLSVSGFLDSLTRLFTNIDRLCRLQELSLVFWVDESESLEKNPTTSFPNNGSVKSLNLSLLQSVPDSTPTKAKPMRKRFSELVIQSLSAVQYLSLTCRHSYDNPTLGELLDITVLSRLSHLQRLTLHSDLSVDSFELPPCEILNLEFPTQSQFKISNQTTRRLYVSISRSFISVQSLYDRFQSLDDQSWPLEKLTVPIDFIGNSHTRFPHLIEISLKGILRYDLTGFCANLALYPTFCPALEVLYMDQCPEWDIFFIMLERRLAWSINELKPLKSITIPYRTPGNLLRHICDILQGRFSDRPSNFDLSILATLEVILDNRVYVSIRFDVEVIDRHQPRLHRVC
jgi:hypothetical protein